MRLCEAGPRRLRPPGSRRPSDAPGVARWAAGRSARRRAPTGGRPRIRVGSRGGPSGPTAGRHRAGAGPSRRRPRPTSRALFESAPGLYLVLDPDLVIVAASDAYLAATMTRAGRHHGPPALRGLPRQPRRPGHRGRAQPEGVARPRAARAPGRRHVGAEVRRPAARVRGRRLRGALLEPAQLAGPRTRRLAGLHHPPGAGRHGVHPARARRRRARTQRAASTPWRPRSSAGPARWPTPAGRSRRPTSSSRCSTRAPRSSTASRRSSSPT